MGELLWASAGGNVRHTVSGHSHPRESLDGTLWEKQTHFQESPFSGLVPFPPVLDAVSGDSLLRESEAVPSQPKPERADGLASWEHSGIFLQEFHRPRDSSRKTRTGNRTRGSGQQSVPRGRRAGVGLEGTVASLANKSVRSSPPCCTRSLFLTKTSPGSAGRWDLGASLKCFRKGSEQTPNDRPLTALPKVVSCSLHIVFYAASSPWDGFCLLPC